MGKYYAWSKKNRIIVQRPNAVHAAAELYSQFGGVDFGKYVFVSEVGFNRKSGHEGHKQDCKFTFSYIKSLCNI